MKNTILKTIFLTAICLLLFGENILLAQVPVNLTVNGSQSGTKLFQARNSITFAPGFSYIPSGGTMRAEIVDPIMLEDIETAQSNTTSYSTGSDFLPGTIPGEVTVSPIGTVGYTIPFDLPDGIAGLKPNISLSYSTLLEEGIVGSGWKLNGFSSITREPSNMYFDGETDGVDFDNKDRYSLDGQRLIKISGEYGSTNMVFRLEQDPGTKITYDNGKFFVQFKNGLQYEYGYTSDSKVIFNTNNQILSWHVNRVYDRYGNEIKYNYSVINNWIYPISVEYANKSIEFHYKKRRQEKKSYFMGEENSLKY
jgi:hypothetical protein